MFKQKTTCTREQYHIFVHHGSRLSWQNAITTNICKRNVSPAFLVAVS